MERGEQINGNGKWVGQRKGSSQWVWYPGSDQTFEQMCQTFDRMFPAK